MPELVANAGLQGLTFGLAAFGLAVAFRVLRFPDLTADGSFMLGATIFAAGAPVGGWPIALAGGCGGGVLAGLLTAQINARLGVGRLLSGIITTMIAYSLAFHVMGGRSNVGLIDVATMYALALPPLAVAAVFAGVAVGVTWALLTSEFGLVLRATGQDEAIVATLDRSPVVYRTTGLCLANGLVALAGGLVAGQQGFADVNMAVGTVVTLVAALVIGEQVMALSGVSDMAKLVVAPFLGAFTYYLLQLVVLRASLQSWFPIVINPTDLKLVAALCIILAFAIRRPSEHEAWLPL